MAAADMRRRLARRQLGDGSERDRRAPRHPSGAREPRGPRPEALSRGRRPAGGGCTHSYALRALHAPTSCTPTHAPQTPTLRVKQNSANSYCPPEHLAWSSRWPRIQAELARYNADIMFLQV